MALRGSRIEIFDESGFLVASGGCDILVFLTSFQKSDIGWPQHPLTEKMLKCCGINIKISQNESEKTSCELISSRKYCVHENYNASSKRF